MMNIKKGIVYLVGAGPGDPGLFTLKGVYALEKADTIIYDYLANKRLLDYAKKGAKKIFVGKRENRLEQNVIEEQMIQQAKQGKVVVRLKGGDPFIFGRGGEEALALKKAGIAFEIIPGVSSAMAVPAYAGIPLTHRDYVSEVVFISGYKPREDWEALAKMGTLVLLMGSANLKYNLKQLIQQGKNKKTPAAFIQWGTTKKQKTVISTIETLAEEVKKKRLGPPAIVVVGEVVSLNEKLEWFNLND